MVPSAFFNVYSLCKLLMFLMVDHIASAITRYSFYTAFNSVGLFYLFDMFSLFTFSTRVVVTDELTIDCHGVSMYITLS